MHDAMQGHGKQVLEFRGSRDDSISLEAGILPFLFTLDTVSLHAHSSVSTTGKQPSHPVILDQ